MVPPPRGHFNYEIFKTQGKQNPHPHPAIPHPKIRANQSSLIHGMRSDRVADTVLLEEVLSPKILFSWETQSSAMHFLVVLL